VPANICKQCGEYYLENDVALKLEKIIEDAEQIKQKYLLLIILKWQFRKLTFCDFRSYVKILQWSIVRYYCFLEKLLLEQN